MNNADRAGQAGQAAGLSDCEGIRPRFSWEMDAEGAPPSTRPRAKKEGNPIWSKWSANWTDRAARRQKSARPGPACVWANSFGRGPQRDTPAAWIVRFPRRFLFSPALGRTASGGNGERCCPRKWWRFSREILERKGKRFRFFAAWKRAREEDRDLVLFAKGMIR